MIRYIIPASNGQIRKATCGDCGHPISGLSSKAIVAAQIDHDSLHESDHFGASWRRTQ